MYVSELFCYAARMLMNYIATWDDSVSNTWASDGEVSWRRLGHNTVLYLLSALILEITISGAWLTSIVRDIQPFCILISNPLQTYSFGPYCMDSPEDTSPSLEI
jgi:hypothetical protein